MKAQDIFDTVAVHLFNQGTRSVDNKYCRYHNDDGLKCSIGVLITADNYFPEIDMGNKSIKSLIHEYDDRFPDWMKENLGLLLALQSVHDKNHNWESSDNMFNALVDVASEFDLSPSILDNLDFKEEKNENE